MAVENMKPMFEDKSLDYIKAELTNFGVSEDEFDDIVRESVAGDASGTDVSQQTNDSSQQEQNHTDDGTHQDQQDSSDIADE